jgi:hypothetical protein
MSFEYTLERTVRSPGEVENAVGLLESDLPKADTVILLAYPSASPSGPPQMFLAGFLKYFPELKTLDLPSRRTVCGSLSNLRSLESVSINCRSLSTEAGDQLMHAVLFHTPMQKLRLLSHTPGPLGITSLISYLRCADITIRSLCIAFDTKDYPALELALEERLGALAIEDIEPAPSRRNLRYRRDIPPICKINEYFRLYRYKKIWDNEKTVEPVRPLILAKFTGPTHRTKLFTLLHRQTDIFRPKDKRTVTRENTVEK